MLNIKRKNNKNCMALFTAYLEELRTNRTKALTVGLKNLERNGLKNVGTSKWRGFGQKV